MEERYSEKRMIRRRYRRAAERIYENSSLRDELNDEQAKRLLDWGSRHLKQVVDETADLADKDAENLLEKETEQVSRVMRQINQLTKSVAAGEPQEISVQIKALREDLDSMLNRPVDSSMAQDRMSPLAVVDSGQVFESLMTMLDGEEE